jgi:hypothetical protein
MLKTKAVLKLALSSSALICLTALLVTSWLLPASGTAIVIDTTPPKVPSEMYVLKTVSKEITRKQVLEIAANVFSVSGEAQFINGSWNVIEGSREVWMYESGSIKYFDNLKMENSLCSPQELPSVKNCLAIAEQFLEKLKAEELISKNLELSFAEVANDTTVFALKDGTTTTFINNIHVNFALSYNGISLWGPGAKVRVYIGEEGEIIGFIGNFWEVELAEKVKILTPEQAAEKLKEVGYGKSIPRDMVSKAIVKSIELVYYAPPPEAYNANIMPFYVIKGSLIGKDGCVADFAQIVSAVSST